MSKFTRDVPGSVVINDYCCLTVCKESADCTDANGNRFCAKHYKEYGLTRPKNSKTSSNRFVGKFDLTGRGDNGLL